jgi:hypothetical protein
VTMLDAITARPRKDRDMILISPIAVDLRPSNPDEQPSPCPKSD